MHLLQCFCGNDATYKLYSYNETQEKEYVCSTCASYVKNDASASENEYVLPIMKSVITRYKRKLNV